MFTNGGIPNPTTCFINFKTTLDISRPNFSKTVWDRLHVTISPISPLSLLAVVWHGASLVVMGCRGPHPVEWKGDMMGLGHHGMAILQQ